MNVRSKQPYTDIQNSFKSGDNITVHLDLNEKTIGFSHNNTFLGVAYDNVEDGNYRLAIS